jgi:membrane-bound lytic murein transglycosylase D
MLKRKLLRSGLFGNVLLLILAVVNTASTQPALDAGQAINDSDMHCLRFDPVLLQLSGNTEMDALNAPVIALNKQAVKFVDDYVARNSCMLQQVKEKNPHYFKIMDSVFTRYKLPVQLKYLAIVESELKTKAVSKVGAIGVWQFMPETAKIFSLKITAKYDERTHFYKSTVAAARYLRDLHGLFDDWLLVMAAYNAGPGPVYAAIKKSGSRNFWKLQYFLPAETRGHVKKFIGTHYFFEGRGSVTTLTKDERNAYTRSMLAFVEKQNMLFRDNRDAETTSNKSHSGNENGIVIAARIGELKRNEEK